ncbi:50S ribosomal protein L31e [Candidatus Micrarchaeota archaeon]|nr:50S ribosomal protein L31e [Candidatus Micrarchaeota archaeon]
MERVYTIPLRKVFDVPRPRRVPKAIKVIREFLAKHMKVTIDHVFLSEAVNSTIWQRGIKKPPRKIKIKVTKEGDKLIARLIDEKVEKKIEKPKEKPKPKEDERTEEEIKADEKKKELEKEIQREQKIAAAPKKEMIKDLKK